MKTKPTSRKGAKLHKKNRSSCLSFLVRLSAFAGGRFRLHGALTIAFLLACGTALADDKPTARTERQVEGWTVRVDRRLLAGPGAPLGAKSLRFLEAKLSDIVAVVPADRLAKLRGVVIALDLTHGDLKSIQYHPSAEWLTGHGYAADLAKCVHIPRAADLPVRRNVNEQPWVMLHELAHAYHDQVLGFDDARVDAAYTNYKASGRGDATLLYDGRKVRHYALTNRMEFFAEMTEAYFGVNDFATFNRAELKRDEPDIEELLKHIWESPAAKPGR